MKKAKKTLNLIALIGFLVSNFLTPLSYAFAEREFPQADSNSESQQGVDALSEGENSTTEMEQISKPEEPSIDKGVSNTNVDTDPELSNGEVEGLNDLEQISPSPSLSRGEQTSSSFPIDKGDTALVEGIGEVNNDEDAEDLPELTPVEKGPMLRSAGNTQLNWTEGVDFYTISIAKPEGVTDEGPAGFTIMDRNLGATGNEVDTTYGSYTNGTGSYGYHYQWGNNYGFSQGCTISSQWGSCSDGIVPNTNGLSWNSGYNNSGYYSTAFINGDNFDYDVRDDSSHHDGLRGGAADSSDNNRGANETNPEDRQGPCPSGYHVPSAGEWGLLIKYWAYASGYNSLVNGSEGLYYIDDTTARTNFMEYFKLPFAGFRGYFSAFLNGQGFDGIYWSSSPYGSDDPNRRARRLYLGSSLVRADDYEYRAHGYSVRCFKDTYEVPSTYIVRFLDDGIEIGSGAVTQGGLRSEEVPTPEQREGYDFDYRYADGENSEFDFTAPITANTTLHAKWTLTGDLENKIYTGVSGGDITVVYKSGAYDIELTVAGESLPGTYQWGTMSPGEDYSTDDNAWGGSGDALWYDNNNERYKRQGPCPDGYHVPSAFERHKLVVAWCNLDNECVFDADSYFDLGFLYDEDEIGYGNMFKSVFNIADSEFYFWSSSPIFTAEHDQAYVAVIEDESIIPAEEDNRYYDGVGVRCFKNYLTIPTITYTLELHTNGGDVAEEELETDSEGKVTLPNATRVADENGEWIFEGWFASEGESEKIGNSGDVITLTGDMDVYAHWAQTITIRDPENPLSGFTIMDRNLGAITDDISSTGSYGFHYQWGNNYGFLQSLDKTANPEYFSGTRATYEGYEPANPYSNPIFRWGSSMHDYRNTSSDHYDNLWGGGNDAQANNWGANEINPEDRQGPCPEGYHVPSAGEWGFLVKYYRDTYATAVTLNGSNGLYQFDDADARSGFMAYFHIPLAGGRNYNNAFLYGQRSLGLYWSSSSYSVNSDNARYLDMHPSSAVDAGFSDYRTYGHSVRCFKDTYEAPTTTYNLELHANSGDVAENTLETDSEGKVTLPNATRDADENGERVFEGWFAGEGVSEKIGNSGDKITLTGDMDVYAHWAQTITIRDPENPLSGFTIMDRNLGAITNDINSTGSYGFHYQWGNNYGFLQSLNKDDNPERFSEDKATYDDYGPDKPYNNPIFRWGSWMTDYWESNIHYDNLWGGTGDVDNAWDSGNDRSKRQGPCPIDYHVPSQKEWNDLLVLYRSKIYTGEITDEYTDEYGTYYEGDIFGEDFVNYFKVPFAGYRYYANAFLRYQGSYGYYWSSSPDLASSNSARYLYLSSSNVRASGSLNRVYGFSVRCFKDSYEAPTIYTLTFDSQGGDEVATGVAAENTSRIRPENPSKSGFIFVDWYTDTDYETVFDFSTPATENLTVYAKWQKVCEAGETYYEELGECATRDTNNIVYYRTDENGKDVISIISGDIILTMLDKNEGASVAGTGEDSYGELYQRGNNAPIKTAPTSTGRAEYENYWPGHSFYDENFRYGSNMHDYWQNNIHYNNLWGGSGDDTAGDWGGINNGDTRQGPCDTGYHVPSIMEWNTVLQMFASSVGQNLSGTTLHNFTNSTTNARKFINAFKLPFAGYYDSYGASIYNYAFGRYWSSSPYSANDSARFLNLNSSSVNANIDNWRAEGLSVRCFKDSPNAPQTLILTFDANGGELSGADSEGKLIQKVESGKLPQQPVKLARDGYDFEGWYTSTGYETGFDFSTPLAEDMTVYAKWDEVYTITYNLDGGTESLPNPTTYKVESGTFGLYQPTKSGYMFLGWTGSNGDTPNANVYITGGSIGNKTYNAVWGTFEDIDAYFISSTGAISYITLMDRNMGASMTGAGASASTGSYGFHYQWGNNNGFQIGCWEYDCSDTVTENAIGTKAVWNNTYNNKGYNGTMFITGSDDYWEGNQHYAGLWGGSGDNSNNNWGLDTITSSNITNRQGPCPDGYHVPSAGEWDILLKNRANVYIGEGNTLNNWTMDDSMNGFYQDTTGTKLFYEMFDISFPGWRGFTDATIVDVRNTEGFLSSSYNSDSLVDISFVDGVIVSFLGVHHANGYSVRCFSNDYLFTQPSMTIDAKGGTGAMILVEADTIKSLGTPHRANSIFSGWYDADTQGNKIETGNDAPTNLYARWSCEEGYIEVNDECVQAFTVTFDANTNGGTTATGEKLIASGTVLDLSNYTATKTGWIFTGWNTDSGATEPMPNLTVTGATTLYAIFSKTLTVTYATGTGVSEISQNSDNCTLYNTDASCTVVAPDITLSEGYATGVWSNGVYTLNPGEDITLTEDDTYTAIASAIKYSIAYNLDGGTITGSNPEEYTIESGFTLINPTKDDYVFVGWIGTNISIPTITVVVPVGTTGNLSYTANWEEDFNHNGEADSTEVKKVVEFLSGDYGTLLGTTRYEILSGLTLLSTGYVEPTKVANSGYVFSGWDKVIDTTSPIISDITYTAIWGEDKNGNGINDEREDHFDVEFTGGENGTLSGETIWSEILTGLTIDEAGITIPKVIPNSGYVFSGWEPEITGGTVITSGLTVTPIYGEDKNGNGINDEFETKYKVTVNYVYSRGGQASPSVSGMYLSGIAFNYVSPNIQYYTANSGTVSGTGIEQDQTFTVIYTPNTDKNNNGIADEIDGYKPGGGGSGGGGGGGSSSNTGSAGGQTGSQINSNTGDIASSGANNQQPNNTTGSNIQTGNQTPQNNISTGTEVKDIEIIPANTPGNSQGGESYSPEFQQAYKFAKQNGITTMPTIQKAQMNSPLTRIAMAKMLSQYAINVLGKKPDTSKGIIKFNDVTNKMDKQYDNGVTLAYQLGIMGQNMPNNRFRPEDEVTRAEFATALSRMLYNTSDGKYKSTSEYYVNHMKKLKEEGIITKDDPSMKELRGYVMIMLMRSRK